MGKELEQFRQEVQRLSPGHCLLRAARAAMRSPAPSHFPPASTLPRASELLGSFLVASIRGGANSYERTGRAQIHHFAYATLHRGKPPYNVDTL